MKEGFLEWMYFKFTEMIYRWILSYISLRRELSTLMDNMKSSTQNAISMS